MPRPSCWFGLGIYSIELDLKDFIFMNYIDIPRGSAPRISVISMYGLPLFELGELT